MINKTIIITGATSGIGYETAIELSRRGHSIIGIGSSSTSCKTATKNSMNDFPTNTISFIPCDLSNQQEIHNLAQSLSKTYKTIDILINNAGSIFLKKHITYEGLEKTFSVNYLGHFLLTRLMLNKLLTSQNPKIINVSSVAYKKARINDDDLIDPINYSPMKVYSRSKLAQLLFTKHLGNKLFKTPIIVVSMHPGIIATKLLSRNKRWGGTLTYLFKLIGKSPKKGAETLIYLASTPNDQLESTQYYVNSEIEQLLPHAINDEDAKILWDMSSKLCNLPSDLHQY